ncbi:transporter substrate-binding domain-containing protein [Achromobacter xylosoxidans]|uniref:transporter substrate-binding domain-containing protein n=1 Tax=Alcaligenes xylosoxydans xylosoxydans TaxID=85698 RepID=UPI0001F4374F|nr:transporter substrate-binding domain-containing protein [Achromobacter xylosoxidans]EFV86330.1 extracellular solute-binding protein family 3 [Achromobacter xylosoxidans C54]MBK1980221.1 transporter substrate-binding domain-containing protein [Achromobacter xylosoxidans]MCM2572451.1 transporter substrate-binding domain-containing protein [Achromobacter xylosoxidans]MCZ8438610.1 transporter substrate-binding domain-containing protein [Achromobacter xylosoxidans]PNM88827.1 amino acid ABC trans
MKTRNISGRILQAAVALALAAGATGAHADATLDKIKERGTVTIGVLANGGVFGSIDPATQQLVGWNPDLARELAKGLGVKAELVQVQTATRTQFLISGKVDLLIASMELNPERAEILGYAPTPFFRVGGAAATRKDSGIAKWEDLRGKPVCVSQGSSFARPLQADYGAVVKGYKSSSDSLLALRGGQCVAAVHDSTLIHPLLRTNPEWADYHAPIATEVLPANSVVWTRKGEADTIAAVDKVIQGWHRSGWLIATEKRLGIQPAQPLLQELHDKYKQGS